MRTLIHFTWKSRVSVTAETRVPGRHFHGAAERIVDGLLPRGGLVAVEHRRLALRHLDERVALDAPAPAARAVEEASAFSGCDSGRKRSSRASSGGRWSSGTSMSSETPPSEK